MPYYPFVWCLFISFLHGVLAFVADEDQPWLVFLDRLFSLPFVVVITVHLSVLVLWFVVEGIKHSREHTFVHRVLPHRRHPLDRSPPPEYTAFASSAEGRDITELSPVTPRIGYSQHV